jgi:hypothetical protein
VKPITVRQDHSRGFSPGRRHLAFGVGRLTATRTWLKHDVTGDVRKRGENRWGGPIVADWRSAACVVEWSGDRVEIVELTLGLAVAGPPSRGSHCGYPGTVAFVVATVGGLAFGAGVQYLGTLTVGSVLGTWTWTVSGMSAPWLVLPFVAGMTQESGRRAMGLGLLVTAAALVGYFAMAHSPMEGAPLEEFFMRFFTQVRTGYNPLWIVGGVVTGPLYGLLGHRWRVARTWVSAAFVAGALCLEPLGRAVAGMLSRHTVVWGVEVALGAVAATYFALRIATSRRSRRIGHSPSPTI